MHPPHYYWHPRIFRLSYGPDYCEMLNVGADFDLGYQLATEISVENHLPTRLKIIDPQEHSHEERCAIIDAHTLTTIPTTFVFLTTQLSLRFIEVRLQN